MEQALRLNGFKMAFIATCSAVYIHNLYPEPFLKKKPMDNAIYIAQTSLTVDKHICVLYPYKSAILFPGRSKLAVISEPSAPPSPQIAFLKKSGCGPFRIVGQL